MPPSKLIALLLLCNVVSIGIALGVRKLLFAAPETPQVVQDKPADVVPVVADKSPTAQLRVPSQIATAREEEIFVTGILLKADRVILVMSDGSTRTEQDNTDLRNPRLTKVRRNFADFDGKRYWLRPSRLTAINSAFSPQQVAVQSPVTPSVDESQTDSAWLPPDKYGVRKLREKPTLSSPVSQR
ncbi:hypothetical protein [Oleiharenicola lentus]|uniref:hypothetical protein n=1 Tax=Oleiharenicola lentus TaxID=2508720 RepID=UPI003F67F4BD